MKKLLTLLLASSLFCQNIVFSQINTEIIQLNKLYENNHRTMDSASFFTQLYTYHQAAVQKKDKGLELYVQYTKFLYYNSGKEKNLPLAEKMLYQLLPLSKQFQKTPYAFIEGDMLDQLSCHIRKTSKDENKFKIALDGLLKADVIFQNIGYEKCPNIIPFFKHLAEHYMKLNEYQQALKVLKTAEPYILEDTWSFYKIHHYNNTAFCHQKLKEYDKSTENFEKIIPCVIAKEDSIWYGLAKGNIGINYYEQGKFEKAIEFIKIDLEYSLKYKDICSAVTDLTLLGKIARKQKKYSIALQYFHEAEQQTTSCGSKSSLSSIYEATSDTYRDMGNNGMAYQYLVKHRQISDSLRIFVSNQKAMETTVNFEKQKTELQAQLATIEGQRSKWQRNFALLLLLLLAAGGYVWYRREQLKKAVLLKKQRRELDQAHEEIQQIKDNITQKNELIEKFKNELEQRNADNIFDEAGWEELRQSTILTDNDWIKFTNSFEKIYPNFIQKLERKIPNPSQGDLRLLLLTQLQINTRDMAGVLGVSIDAIRKSRYRLRKKLDLPEDNFKYFLENI